MSPLPEPSTPPLTEMDRRGDIVFVVGAGGDDTPVRSFRVCSRTMARVSPVFDRMLHGNFSESKPTPTTTTTNTDLLSSLGTPGTPTKEWIVNLRDDKPEAFDLFASIAHSQYRRIPRSLSIDKLYELTVLTHYYDATPVLTPWLQTWVAGIGEGSEINSSHVAGRDGELLMPKVLWISWELGHKQLFEGTARRLVMESCGSLFGEDSGLGELSMPPDVIERVAAIRVETIQSIMDVFRDLASKLVLVDEGPRWCKHASYMGPHRCESMILGSMTFCLTRAGLWPIPEAEDVEESVLTLYSTLMNLVIHDIGRPGEKGGVDHGECNPRGFLMERIKNILGEVGSPVSEGHRRHLDRQIQRLLV
ncbi:nuclear pore protein [Colletotrichum tofieldiae]|nr:nuclear pore protein [Colletotrichum tofieldiae]GKT67755.1 nuclear pore protein [Colletotrichum tofieldiae]